MSRIQDPEMYDWLQVKVHHKKDVELPTLRQILKYTAVIIVGAFVAYVIVALADVIAPL